MKRRELLFSILIALIFCFHAVLAGEAHLSIYKNNQKSGIRREIYGSFIEYINHFVNSKYGFWAQEIVNRGFDRPSIDGRQNVSKYWHAFPSNDVEGLELVPGGYNRKGTFAQRITKTVDSPSRLGVSQELTINGDVDHTCYFYFRSDQFKGDVKIIIFNRDFSRELFSCMSGSAHPVWQKLTCTIPALKESQIQIVFALEVVGSVDIDEVSLMPMDNVGGVRKEFYEAYKSWRPGIFRYPGGSFADMTCAHWRDGIGDIDQRAPLKITANDYDQRLEFGTDEYLKFCESIGIEPHIVTNLVNGTPEEAADWVEYCNGSADTPMGRLRTENGRTQPYKVRYWELGNEQWSDTKWTAERSLLFNEAMKKKDSSILTIVDGNVWGWYWHVSEMMGIVYGKCDIYAWHEAQVYCYRDTIPLIDNYYSLMGNINSCNQNIQDEIGWLKETNTYEGTKIGITELWIGYAWGIRDWTDTKPSAYNLVSGLWTAAKFLSYQRYPECFIIGERTHGLGMIRGNISSKSGDRVFYASPSYWAVNMLANHSGTSFIHSSVESDTFHVVKNDCLEASNKVPFIQTTVTATKDTLFIATINAHISDSIRVKIDIDEFAAGRSAQVYQLYSDSYEDQNTPENPEKIKPKQFQIYTPNQYTFPPHSFTIIAIPCSDALNGVDGETNSKLRISPIPFNEYFSLAIENETIGTIEIFDVFGNILYTGSIVGSKDEQRINSSDWPQGIYFIKCKTTESTTISKIVKISK